MYNCYIILQNALSAFQRRIDELLFTKEKEFVRLLYDG